MWDLGDLLGLSEGGAEVERLPRTSLPRHKMYNTGRTRVPEAVQRGGGKYHNNLAKPLH